MRFFRTTHVRNNGYCCYFYTINNEKLSKELIKRCFEQEMLFRKISLNVSYVLILQCFENFLQKLTFCEKLSCIFHKYEILNQRTRLLLSFLKLSFNKIVCSCKIFTVVVGSVPYELRLILHVV